MKESTRRDEQQVVASRRKWERQLLVRSPASGQLLGAADQQVGQMETEGPLSGRRHFWRAESASLRASRGQQVVGLEPPAVWPASGAGSCLVSSRRVDGVDRAEGASSDGAPAGERTRLGPVWGQTKKRKRRKTRRRKMERRREQLCRANRCATSGGPRRRLLLVLASLLLALHGHHFGLRPVVGTPQVLKSSGQQQVSGANQQVGASGPGESLLRAQIAQLRRPSSASNHRNLVSQSCRVDGSGGGGQFAVRSRFESNKWLRLATLQFM